MITEFKIFNKVEFGLNPIFEKVIGAKVPKDILGSFFYIPYSDMNLIEVAIDKLKLGPKLKNNILLGLKDKPKTATILLAFSKSVINRSGNESDWGYWSCDSDKRRSEGEHFFMSWHMTYMGEILLEPYEIEANKYNL